MKNILQSFKSMAIMLGFIFMGISAFGQNSFCEEFSQDTSLWVPELTASQSPDVPGPTGLGTDFFMRSYEDGPGYIYNNTDFRGNWDNFIDQCLCWDFQVFDHNGTNPSVTPTISIYVGSPTSPSLMATFVANFSVASTDGWVHLCAPILSCGTTLPGNGQGQWQMDIGSGCADFNTLLGAVDGVRLNVDYTVGDFGEQFGFDNICIEDCEMEEPPTNDGAYCCEGDNLVVNGNFEGGNAGFTSTYTQTAATYPGEYDVTTSASNFGANITDHSFCEDATLYGSNDMFMVVNGKTQQAGSSVIWEQNITGLEQGKEYKFCANFKDMEQCTFNIYPRISMNTNYGSISQIIDTDDTDPCDWQRIEFCFIADGPDINLQIELDETGNGDGNDLAIDDIALQEKLDPEYFLTVQHQGDTNLITGSLNTIATTDDTLFDRELCEENDADDYYWFVYEPIDPNNPNLPIGVNITPGTFAWGSNVNGTFGPWSLTTTFPAYLFAQNTFYVIGMWIPSCCESCYTESWEYQISYNNGLLPMNEEEYTDKMKAEIKSRFVMGDGVNTRGAESLNTKLSLFPNPAKNSFDIALEQDIIKTINIMSITGQVVFSEETQGENQKTVDISNLTSGMYFVNVVGENQKRYTAKLVKE